MYNIMLYVSPREFISRKKREKEKKKKRTDI